MKKENSRSSDEISEIWRLASSEIEEAKNKFENSRPLCPSDKTPGKFIEYRGAYTRVRGFFKCQNGHEFPMG